MVVKKVVCTVVVRKEDLTPCASHAETQQNTRQRAQDLVHRKGPFPQDLLQVVQAPHLGAFRLRQGGVSQVRDPSLVWVKYGKQWVPPRDHGRWIRLLHADGFLCAHCQVFRL